MQYALIVLVVAVFAVALGQVWLRRRKQAPLRREVRSQSVTFWVRLTGVKQWDGGVMRWLPVHDNMALYVRGDSFEISSTIFPPIRVLMGDEYFFKARETLIEMSKEPSRHSERDWIIVTGRQDSEEIKLAITDRDEYKLHDAWNALATAGAIPIGPGPDAPARLDR